MALRLLDAKKIPLLGQLIRRQGFNQPAARQHARSQASRHQPHPEAQPCRLDDQGVLVEFGPQVRGGKRQPVALEPVHPGMRHFGMLQQRGAGIIAEARQAEFTRVGRGAQQAGFLAGQVQRNGAGPFPFPELDRKSVV